VRSSKCGHAERNFRFNSDRVFMLRKHTSTVPWLIPLFIYSALAFDRSRSGFLILDAFLIRSDAYTASWLHCTGWTRGAPTLRHAQGSRSRVYNASALPPYGRASAYLRYKCGMPSRCSLTPTLLTVRNYPRRSTSFNLPGRLAIPACVPFNQSSGELS
jgi:hypothetical protein